jgi:cytochrome c oxidase cbb3-type subunit 3
MCAKKVKKGPGQVETTGHSWDGIEEFDNPMPRWWVWTFYATIVWGIGYTIAYPAWPLITRATQGYLGYSTRANVAAEIQRFDDANAEIKAKLVATDLTRSPPMPGPGQLCPECGAAVFKTWCAQCHGAGAAGVQSLGYPNLLDDDWLWGGTMDDDPHHRHPRHPQHHRRRCPLFGNAEALASTAAGRNPDRRGGGICPATVGAGA